MERVEMALGRHTLSIETGKMAKQADGAVVVRVGDTVVLATACAQKEPKAGIDFMPLTVDYREGNYAGGKIPGGFFKREGRPNEKEVLTSRMIDRPLRPLFPEGYACETQVIGLLLSADLENDSDTLAIIGASTALYISDIPFDRPVGAVRVGYWDGACVVNPATADLKAKSQLNLLVAGHRGRDRDGRGRRQRGERGGDDAGARRGPRRHQADRRDPEGPAREGREVQAAPRQEDDRPGRGGDDRGRAHRAPARGSAPQGQDRVLRPG
jgi:ribonuclease PH